MYIVLLTINLNTPKQTTNTTALCSVVDRFPTVVMDVSQYFSTSV